MPPTDTDIHIVDHGSIVVFGAESPSAVTWITEHVASDDGYQPGYPDVVYVEARFARDLLASMLADGLVVT